jgi:hypothetical protein
MTSRSVHMALTLSTALVAHPILAADPEVDELTFGFIKLTDMAHLAIATEKGFFEKEGLFVTLEAQSNWKVLLARVIAGELQEVLMAVWSRTKVTAICVTHDVDEAILLADRVVMMTNGPRATVCKITEVNLPRPRTRKALLDRPDPYHFRQQVLDFLEAYEHGA